MADKFRTQDDPLTGVVSYVLTMPAATWFEAEVSDLLRDMCLEENWEQVGSVSIDEATAAATAMYLGMRKMIGMVFAHVAQGVPPNCLKCDGSIYQRVDYPELYAAIATAFHADADSFYVPNLSCRTVIGIGYDPGLGNVTIGQWGGESVHTLSTDEMPVHNHTDSGHAHTTGNSLAGLAVAPGEEPVLLPNPIPAMTGYASANIGNAGGIKAHNNMPPFQALEYVIVAR